MNYIEIDYRYGSTSTMKTYDGFLLQSFEAEKKYVDRAKELGWDGISFVTNTPVNRSTGLVQTSNTVDPNTDPDRTYPDDLWKLVDYAKSIGLKVHIQLEIVDYLTDVLVSPQTLASSVIISELFKSIKDYQCWIAKDAQIHGVESINIGSLFFLEDEYESFWKENTSALRDVYKGKLSISTHFNSQPHSFYSFFDFVSLFGFGDLLADYWTKTVEDLVRLYTAPELLFPNGAAQPNHIVKLQKFIEDCEIPVALLKMFPAVASGAGGLDPWQPWVSLEVPAHLQKYLGAEIDYSNQLMAIEAYYNILNDQFSGQLEGTFVGGYGSWADSEYYFSMPNQEQTAWNLFHRMSAALNPAWNPVADVAISESLRANHPHYIHYDSTENSTYAGLSGQDNSFIWMTGNDIFTGAERLDKAFAPGAMKDAKLSHSNDALTITASAGNLTLKAVERIVFSDQAIAYDLQGHAGQVAKTLGAVFGKTAVTNKEYAGIGLYFVDDLNYTYANLLNLAINAKLGSKPSNDQIVDMLYTNVVGTAPDAATRKSFTDLLDNGTFTVASLGVLAAETDLNKANINLVGLAQSGLEYLPFAG